LDSFLIYDWQLMLGIHVTLFGHTMLTPSHLVIALVYLSQRMDCFRWWVAIFFQVGGCLVFWCELVPLNAVRGGRFSGWGSFAWQNTFEIERLNLHRLLLASDHHSAILRSIWNFFCSCGIALVLLVFEFLLSSLLLKKNKMLISTLLFFFFVLDTPEILSAHICGSCW
jgi:hypothetical protein